MLPRPDCIVEEPSEEEDERSISSPDDGRDRAPLAASQTSIGIDDGASRRLREVLLTVGLRALVGYRAASDEGDDALAAALDANTEAAIYGGADQLRFSVATGDVGGFDAKTLPGLGYNRSHGMVDRIAIYVHRPWPR